MMWILLLLYTAHIEPVFLQGDLNRLILKNGENPCEGHIEIYHNKTWGYVGVTSWSGNTEEVVCRSTHCGKPVSVKEILRPTGSTVLLNEIECNGNESHLWDCANPGWGISIYPRDTMKKIKCSNEIKIYLDGYRCAGAVQYSIGEGQSGYFCADKWGPDEANLLCQSLGCGTSEESPRDEWMFWKRFKSSPKMMINCLGIENLDNLWQCATTQESWPCSIPASVICTGHKRVQLKGDTSNVCHGQLEREENGNWSAVNNSNKVSPDVWCKQLSCGTSASVSLVDNGMQLKCTDNVAVVLMDKNRPSKCYGAVHITVNASSHHVCASTWTNEEAEVVCRELNCGKLVSKTIIRSNTQDGIMDNVKCSGTESSLWHCRAKRDSKPFSCSSYARVVCADSVNVRLTDGPGRCSGRVEIEYDGQWQKASKQEWSNDNSDVVCKQLKCGNKRSPVKSDIFSQGSADFLAKVVKCKSNALHISECITDDPVTLKKTSVALTCEEHKVVFLKGNRSCSGMVGIEHGDKTYWLSGSNKTWNQESANTVCQQMHCGEASTRTSVPHANMGKDVWHESYSCSSNITSLFECENTTLPSDHNNTIATVTCSGNINVTLTKGCWGNVNVCVGGKCGGVCKDTWEKKKSKMLCESLGCGNVVLPAYTRPEEGEVIVKSFHSTKHTTNLDQCNLVLGTTCNPNPAYVVCSGSVKAKINVSRYKCSGNVEMYYEGQPLPVCMDALQNIQTQKTICEEMNCGEPVKRVDYFGPQLAETRVISQVQCPSTGNKSLSACSITTDKKVCTLGGLRCSSWRKMELKCNNTCRGAVFIHSEESRSAVSIEGWTETEGMRLCQDLKCGKFKSNTTTESDSFWKRSFSCEGVADPINIWDCEKPTLPSQKQQLFIECQEEPKITLSERCSGEVRINNVSVCSRNWRKAYSHLVCQEQACSNAIFYDNRPTSPDVKYHHVTCEDYHDKLGQCSRFKGNCEEGPVSVYCVGNVKFNTTEKCGGRIKVNYRNKWEEVCELSFPPQLKDKLCRYLGCGGHNGSIKSTDNKKVSLETKLECTEDHKDIKHCVTQMDCQTVPADIYCNGYVKKPDEGKSSLTPEVPIILGVGSLLVLVILTVVFVRIRIVKRAKKPVKVPPRMLSRREVEFESGDYEDVLSKPNEMEHSRHGRIGSEAEVLTGSNMQSTSSIPYDDIDEVVETRPLTSQTATAGAPGRSYFHEDVLNQSSDEVTYEVENPQENYDDIEASLEITQTNAEVHYSPQTTPESTAVAPPGLMRGDEDYLVPGQDG